MGLFHPISRTLSKRGRDFVSLRGDERLASLTTLIPRLYFSYGQFFVYDFSVTAPGCLWTDAHNAQGFARRDSAVSFGTLLEFGYADVRYRLGSFQPNDAYERVIAVPFLVCTGKVIVDGPEEINIQRNFELPTGNYRVFCGQRLVGHKEERIDLFFERLDEPLGKSEVVVADAMLDPPLELVETAEVA